jgi:transposase
MTKPRIRRPVARINTDPQLGLLPDHDIPAPPATVASKPDRVRFIDNDPREIRVGANRLDEHLKQMGVTDALVVREVLGKADWSVFEASYEPGGRPPYAPRAVAGIVLYGVTRGISSLRELERFARCDLGCMWVSGGITPDHSVLGRFIQRHEQALSQELFEQVISQALKRTDSGRAYLAGDGTTLEAMSSRFALIKREAVQAWHEGLATRVDASAQEREQAERALQTLADRPSAKAIVPAEPEAALLKLKNNRGFRPAFEAVVTANDARVVVDAELDSTSELAAMKQLLERMPPGQTQEVLLDAGFSNDFGLIEKTVSRSISLLSPEQAETPRADAPTLIPLREFRYDEVEDVYVCPQGHRLMPVRRNAGSPPQAKKKRRPYVQYAAREQDCGGCERRSGCTRGRVRTIQRDYAQELKEALRIVMAQPRAKRRFAQRKAMVEPVFADLRERQGLHRFRRRGLSGARLEFRIHLTAYNLRRILAAAWTAAAEAFLAPILALVERWRARGALYAERQSQISRIAWIAPGTADTFLGAPAFM